MFNKGKIEELNSEITNLTSTIADLSKFGAMNAVQVEQEILHLKTTKIELEEQINSLRQGLLDLKKSLIETEEIAMLQEVGIYQYSTVLESSIGYSEK